MTNELEKQFFDTFGIKPKYESHSCDGWGRTVEVKYFTDKKEAEKFGIVVSELEYPEITDRILLELFDILRKYYNLNFWTTIDDYFVMDMRDKQASYTNIIYRTGGDFKNSILTSLNLIVKDRFIGNDKIKQQVRTLFEEV